MINTREIASEYRLSHWAGIIQERNASGLNIKTYCESIGLRVNVYHYWQRKLREAACKGMLPAAVNGSEVTKVPVGWTSVQTQSISDGEVTIEIGKSRVIANKSADLEVLSNVCRILMSLC